MIDGEVLISGKQNIGDENDFTIKCDRIERDDNGNITSMQLKLTQTNSLFQVKIRLNSRGYNFLERLVLDEFVSRERKKEDQD